jgi:hypothetical protein
VALGTTPLSQKGPGLQASSGNECRAPHEAAGGGCRDCSNTAPPGQSSTASPQRATVQRACMCRLQAPRPSHLLLPPTLGHPAHLPTWFTSAAPRPTDPTPAPPARTKNSPLRQVLGVALGAFVVWALFMSIYHLEADQETHALRQVRHAAPFSAAAVRRRAARLPRLHAEPWPCGGLRRRCAART